MRKLGWMTYWAVAAAFIPMLIYARQAIKQGNKLENNDSALISVTDKVKIETGQKPGVKSLPDASQQILPVSNEPLSILRPSLRIPLYNLVAHGLGEYNSVRTSNSKEALAWNYQQGVRLFETDLTLTADGQVVVFHDDTEYILKSLSKPVTRLTEQEFLAQQRYDGLSLMTLDDLLSFFDSHKDAYLITDLKYHFGLIMTQVVAKARKYDGLLDRIIPQAYQVPEIEELSRLYNFRDMIFTLYANNLSDQEVIEAVKGTKVTAVAAWWDKRYRPELAIPLKAMDIATFVHTVNDTDTVRYFLSLGVGVYTDYPVQEQILSGQNCLESSGACQP